MSAQKIKKINTLLVNHFGIPKRNKKLPDPVDLLIATILSQNTNDKNSFRAFQNLKTKFPKWELILSASREEIEEVIKIAGLGKQKSSAIKNFIDDLHSKQNKISLNNIVNKNNFEILDELTDYKGIGIKTASCVLLFALDKNVCPVDTHVFRTLNRIGIVKENSPDKTFWKINEKLPDGIAHQFHTNLIRLGREICKPKSPLCSVCPLLKICKYPEKNLTIIKEVKQNEFMLLDNVE